MDVKFKLPIKNFGINGMTFTQEAVKEAVDNYQPIIKENLSLGELNHSTNFAIDLSNVSHVVKELKIEGDSVVGEVEILTSKDYDEFGMVSTKGDMFAELLKNGVPYAFEPLMLGNQIRSIDICTK